MTDTALSRPGNRTESDRAEAGGRPWFLIVILLLCGAVGLWAAGALTVDKIAVAADANASLDCNFSVLIQCGKNLGSWQGAVFGFPNPILGLVCWCAPIVVAMGLIAGARFASWFWWLFNLGHLFAFGFCIWLMDESILSLGTLCPYCMLTWTVAILSFWALTFHNAKEGRFGAWAVRPGTALYTWSPLVAVGCYVIIAVIAQLRLDVLATL